MAMAIRPPPADGRETQLVLDTRFRPFLAQYLTAPQTFWGSPKTGYKPLDETALDFLSVPDKVLADDNRYLSITGCVFRFNPARGLLWVDLGLPILSLPSPPSTGSRTAEPQANPAPSTLSGSSPTIPSTQTTSPGAHSQRRALDRPTALRQHRHSTDHSRHSRRPRRHASSDSAGSHRSQHIHQAPGFHQVPG
ncbi:hypothetical protein RBB78_13750 [Tunturiibacter empetritectus]|uniref:hypothetical protein n=1 Tax=Tunturiibacter empetritectus TaxID=3069691 RepID=UPI003D9BAD03